MLSAVQIALAAADATQHQPPSVWDVISIADTVEKGGIATVLVLVCGVFVWLFRDERKKNEALHAQIAATNEAMINALGSTKTAVDGLRESLVAIKAYLEASRGHK